MVRIFSVYRFSGQVVNSIDEMSALTITNHNKLLIAQPDYTIEVKDLLIDKKTPIFVFPTVDQVLDMIHCASGNYVATLEGKQTFQKSDVLIVRVYTNWELDDINEEKMFTKHVKRFVRPRIAGVVSPSYANSDDDYLDMIEIPISFMSPTFITCCQKTGRLLIACGPTIHLFNQVYNRGHKSHFFMDFVPITEVFELAFLPTSVNICENVISAYCNDMISVFKLTKVNEKFLDTLLIHSVDERKHDYRPDCENRVTVRLNVDNILKVVEENRENDLFGIIDPSSFPIAVHLKGMNDDVIASKQKKFPFKILNRKSKYELKNGRVSNNLVNTLYDENLTIVAESLLALKLTDPDEPVRKIGLQVFSRISDYKDYKKKVENCELNYNESDEFIGIHFIITTFQEGYLFYASDINLKEGLQCVAVLNFTDQVVSVLYESYFLHVLTQAGLETYNLPTFHSIILNERPNTCKNSKCISILGIQPFIGVVDFIASNDFMTIFTSADDEIEGKRSLPWTVYSLRKPHVHELFEEIIEIAGEFKLRDAEAYRYLLLQAFLVLHTSLHFDFLSNFSKDDNAVRIKHMANSLELAELCFRTENEDEIMKGASIIIASEANPRNFINKFENDKNKFMPGILHLLKNWMERKKQFLTDQDLEWIIEFLGENGEMKELAVCLLFSDDICRSLGHKAMPYLKKYYSSKSTEPDLYVLYVLCILYTQVCMYDEASNILESIRVHQERRQISFVQVALKYWKFLFDEIINNDEKSTSFSELASLLIDKLPFEMCQILAELILKLKKFTMLDIVQMLLKQFPCRVSVQKGHFVLQTLLELIFSSKLITDSKDPCVNNCLKILTRSYLTQLFNKECENENNHSASSSYQPVFVESLPSFIEYLPTVENVSYKTLRKLQELIWSRMLDEEIVKEIVEPLPNIELKLNIMAMLGHFDFVKELMKNNFTDAILPYAKLSFTETRKWRDLLILVESRIIELKNLEQKSSTYEDILTKILDYLACSMGPSELSTILESVINQNDDMYHKYLMKAQQMSYANDVKELIINTSQHLLHSHLTY